MGLRPISSLGYALLNWRPVRWAMIVSAVMICIGTFVTLPAGYISAASETRTLSLFNVHTKESITVTFKKNGRYIPSAMRELNHFLRDWRNGKVVRMDPKLFDLIWELHARLGSTETVHVISAYRSVETNRMLQRAGRNVATRSQHTTGRAIDIYFPDVPTERLRNVALARGVGGVGYYPRSGAQGFVHVDTGNVRHWPRVSEQQLASIRREYKDYGVNNLARVRDSAPTQTASAPRPPAEPVPTPRAKPVQLARIASEQRQLVASIPSSKPPPETTGDDITVAAADMATASETGPPVTVLPAAAPMPERQSFASSQTFEGRHGVDSAVFRPASQPLVPLNASLHDEHVLDDSENPLAFMPQSIFREDRFARGTKPDHFIVAGLSSAEESSEPGVFEPILEGLRRIFLPWVGDSENDGVMSDASDDARLVATATGEDGVDEVHRDDLVLVNREAKGDLQSSGLGLTVTNSGAKGDLRVRAQVPSPLTVFAGATAR